jgi:hypothetical protein
MFDFTAFMAICLVMGGYCIAALLSDMIPVDRARLPRLLARIYATSDRNEDPRLIPTVFHRATVFGTAALIAYTQFLIWSSLVIDPTWALAYGQGRLIGFFCVEVPLLVWTITVFLLFRRAAPRSR